MELYCQEITQECHWTRTGQCLAKTAYNCKANLPQAERDIRQQREREAEYRYCADAAEAEFGNTIN